MAGTGRMAVATEAGMVGTAITIRLRIIPTTITETDGGGRTTGKETVLHTGIGGEVVTNGNQPLEKV